MFHYYHFAVRLNELQRTPLVCFFALRFECIVFSLLFMNVQTFKAYPLVYVPSVLTFNSCKAASRVNLSVFYVTQNTQRYLPHTKLTDWFL